MHSVPLHSLDDALRAQARVLYEEAFPAWERGDFAQLIRPADDPSAAQLGLVEDGTLLGLAALSSLASGCWWFLEYFAVTRDRRGGGLGSTLWEEMTTRLPGSRVVLEIEDPRQAGLSEEAASNRDRRKSFYLRHGATELDVPGYRIPRLDGTGTEPMVLLAALPAGEVLTGDDLRALVTALLVEEYGLGAGSPLVVDALGSIPD